MDKRRRRSRYMPLKNAILELTIWMVDKFILRTIGQSDNRTIELTIAIGTNLRL
ncbi:MAG: hypothetical protein ACI837_000910 [Crocinitomicaceae bacterium]|jgi:hypothetical protein